MMVDKELIDKTNNAIKSIIMSSENITKYLDLYNYPIDCYDTMDEYILDKYNYELFGKSVLWSEFETIGSKEIYNFIPAIINISYSYNKYYEVISWIQNKEYYKLMSLYALSISYKIIKANSASIKMTWFNNDTTYVASGK